MDKETAYYQLASSLLAGPLCLWPVAEQADLVVAMYTEIESRLNPPPPPAEPVVNP